MFSDTWDMQNKSLFSSVYKILSRNLMKVPETLYLKYIYVIYAGW